MFTSINGIEYPVQVRSETTGMVCLSTLDEALDLAQHDKSIWKISFFSLGRERVRLVKVINVGWVLEDIYGSRNEPRGAF